MLVLLAEGRTNREIAGALSVTARHREVPPGADLRQARRPNRNEALGRAVALGLLR